jgi:hypothetical protein
MGLRGLFGLIFRSLRLHANLFSIFRSWFGDVDGPETLSSRGTLVNAIRSAWAFVIVPERFPSFLPLVTPDEMVKAVKAVTKTIERRKAVGFIQ